MTALDVDSAQARHAQQWTDFLEALRAEPGVWTAYPPGEGSPAATARAVNDRRLAGCERGEFEARVVAKGHRVEMRFREPQELFEGRRRLIVCLPDREAARRIAAANAPALVVPSNDEWAVYELCGGGR